MGAGRLSQTGIAVSCSSDNSSKAMLYSLAGGISATGTRVFNMGQMFLGHAYLWRKARRLWICLYILQEE